MKPKSPKESAMSEVSKPVASQVDRIIAALGCVRVGAFEDAWMEEHGEAGPWWPHAYEEMRAEIERLRGGQQWRLISEFNADPFRRVFVCQADSESCSAVWSDEVEHGDWTHFCEPMIPTASKS